MFLIFAFMATKKLTITEKWKKDLAKTGVKQSWLATQVGISRFYLSNILSGRMKLPDELKEKINTTLGTKYK